MSAKVHCEECSSLATHWVRDEEYNKMYLCRYHARQHGQIGTLAPTIFEVKSEPQRPHTKKIGEDGCDCVNSKCTWHGSAYCAYFI